METVIDAKKEKLENHFTETQHDLQTSSSLTPSKTPITSINIPETESSPGDIEKNEQETVIDSQNFSQFRKNLIVFIIAYSVFLAPMSSMCLLPAVPTIASHFHTTGFVINASIDAYNVMMAKCPCVLNPLCNIYGRRITFLSFLALFLLVSVLTAISRNLIMVFVFPGMTAFFGTTFFGDIYRPTERGTAQSLKLDLIWDLLLAVLLLLMAIGDGFSGYNVF